MEKSILLVAYYLALLHLALTPFGILLLIVWKGTPKIGYKLQ